MNGFQHCFPFPMRLHCRILSGICHSASISCLLHIYSQKCIQEDSFQKDRTGIQKGCRFQEGSCRCSLYLKMICPEAPDNIWFSEEDLFCHHTASQGRRFENCPLHVHQVLFPLNKGQFSNPFPVQDRRSFQFLSQAFFQKRSANSFILHDSGKHEIVCDCDFVIHILTPIHDLQRLNSPQYLYLLKIKKDHFHSNFFAQRIEATPQAFWSEAEEWSALTRNCGKPGFYCR